MNKLLNQLRIVLICTTALSFLSITSCKKDEDPCKDTKCLNGGVCVDGSCNCPNGFYGSDCSKQRTPLKILINKIEVQRFPATDGGAGWDFSSGPDILPKMFFNGSLIYESNEYVSNANPSSYYEFIPSPSIEIINPFEQYSLSLYDYDDLDPDDFMGGVLFYPYSSTGGFPNTIYLDAGGDVAFKIYVSYIF